MGDLYTRCEIYIISVVLPIAVWEVPSLSYQLTLTNYLELLITSCLVSSANTRTILKIFIHLLVQLQSRVNMHKYCTRIYSHQVYIALLVMKTSQVCLHSCAHTWAITDIIKLLDYSGLHAVVLRSYNWNFSCIQQLLLSP